MRMAAEDEDGDESEERPETAAWMRTFEETCARMRGQGGGSDDIEEATCQAGRCTKNATSRRAERCRAGTHAELLPAPDVRGRR